MHKRIAVLILIAIPLINEYTRANSLPNPGFLGKTLLHIERVLHADACSGLREKVQQDCAHQISEG